MDEQRLRLRLNNYKALEDKYRLINRRNIIELILQMFNKQRYELKNHKIRAYYSHSLQSKIKRNNKFPPHILYHGTAKRFIPSIMQKGLQPMNRQYVHLSLDKETALQVGKRHDSSQLF